MGTEGRDYPSVRGDGPASDSRGQSTLLGFLFVVGILVLVFSLYQAVIVPQHNAKVEFQHAQTMEERMGDLTDRIYLVGKTGGTQSITFNLGVDYPPRVLAINPAPPAGRLHTNASGRIHVFVGNTAVNLTDACGYGGTHIESRSIAFDGEYNAYSKDPSIVYDHTALYRKTANGYQLLSEDQSLVRNDTITLIPVANNYSRATAGSVTTRIVGGPVNRTTVTDGTNDSVKVVIPSALPASKWRTLLADQPNVTDVRQQPGDEIGIVLEPGNYTLACYAVGLDQAPPSGMRSLHAPILRVNQTSTTTSPTAADPHPSIDDITITREQDGFYYENNVTVNWSVTDDESDLKSVEVRVVDLNTSETKKTKYQVSGANASGQFQEIFGDGKKDQGDTYRVVVIAKDTAGNEARVEETKSLQ